MTRGVSRFITIALAFAAGWFAQVLYQRWNPPMGETAQRAALPDAPRESVVAPGQPHRVTYMPLAEPAAAVTEPAAEVVLVQAREVDKIRALTGKQARVRGRVFRVGHSAKSNTYFLNFGPSREALTAVIFSSSVELFEKSKLAPKGFENKDVEISGLIKDHPQYGLEIILENPKQIKILN